MAEKELTINEALNFAVGKHKEGKLREAEIIYKRILEKEPNHPDAMHLLGTIAYQTGKYEEAVECIKKAIRLAPNCAFFYGNLGMSYDKLGKEEESAINFRRALEINPKYNGAHFANYNLGVFFKDKGEIMKALEYYDRAIELNPDFFDAHWNRSSILLLLGRFKEGWKEYEYRFKKNEPTDSRVFLKPKWDGSLLGGRKILIVCEQGFGDNIQFIRYAPLVKERGGRIILECKRELRKLFESIPEIDEFIEKEGNGFSNAEFDCYTHLMSLPQIFDTNIDTIPCKIPYLKSDKNLSDGFNDKLKTGNFKIGIAWAGNPRQENDKNRSVTFDKFKRIASISGISLFSLQKGEAAVQLNDRNVIDMAGEIKDFADTAAIIENLDLVISVDTSVAHLAGAMGKRVWTLLSFIPDWRWLLNRNDSPWYSSMKLFRQKKQGDWDSVFIEVINELKNLLGGEIR